MLALIIVAVGYNVNANSLWKDTMYTYSGSIEIIYLMVPG